MGKANTKQALKRKAARVWVHLDNAAAHIADLYAVISGYHPELAQALEAMGKQVLIVQSELEDFWRVCWGELPDNMANWT